MSSTENEYKSSWENKKVVILLITNAC